MLLIRCVADSLFLATPKKKGVVPAYSLVRILCVVGAGTQALIPYLRALCYCFGACTCRFTCFLSLFGFVLLCLVDFPPTSPNSGAKTMGGFLRSEKSVFPCFSLFSALFSFFFFLFHWRA